MSWRVGPWERMMCGMRRRVRAIQAVSDAELTWVLLRCCDGCLPCPGGCCVALLRGCAAGDVRAPQLAAVLLCPELPRRRRRPPPPVRRLLRPRPCSAFPASSKYLLAPALRALASLYASYNGARHFFYRQVGRAGRGGGRVRRPPLHAFHRQVSGPDPAGPGCRERLPPGSVCPPACWLAAPWLAGSLAGWPRFGTAAAAASRRPPHRLPPTARPCRRACCARWACPAPSSR